MTIYHHVYCEDCGLSTLTDDQYLAQLNHPNWPWYCPGCGDEAEFEGQYADCLVRSCQGLVEVGYDICDDCGTDQQWYHAMLLRAFDARPAGSKWRVTFVHASREDAMEDNDNLVPLLENFSLGSYYLMQDAVVAHRIERRCKSYIFRRKYHPYRYTAANMITEYRYPQPTIYHAQVKTKAHSNWRNLYFSESYKAAAQTLTEHIWNNYALRIIDSSGHVYWLAQEV